MSHRIICSPITLASLSKPASSTNGRIHAAQVCSLNGIKKRKRSEIVVGLNGKELSIYNVHNPRLVTSYAFPPTASLTFAPYSIYRKGSTNSPSHRFTYASLVNSTYANKSQLVCFHEEILGDQSRIIKTSYTHNEHPSQLMSIESIPVAAGGSASIETHDILATFDNGDVICLSADLQITRWVANLSLMVSSEHGRLEVEHVTMANAGAVTRGLLKNRGDVVTVLNTTVNDDSRLFELTQVLCVIGSLPTGCRTLSLLQVQSRSPDLTTYISPLKHLISWELPQSSKASLSSENVAQFILHAPSGALHVLTGSTLLLYDLDGTTPKLSSELELSDPNIESFSRISRDIIFTISRDMCCMIDVRFKSLQASLALKSSLHNPDTQNHSKKRKNEETSTTIQCLHQPQSLIAYYSEAGLLIVIREKEIQGVQIEKIKGSKRVKTDGTLLLEALGKGLESSEEHDLRKWKKKQKKFDLLISEGNVSKFETCFALDLNIKIEGCELEPEDKEICNRLLREGSECDILDENVTNVGTLAEELARDELRGWEMPRTVNGNKRRLYHQYALYALSKIFCWCDPETDSNTISNKECSWGHLKIQFFPPSVFQWLLQTGYLTKECIRKSLIRQTPKNNDLMFKIVDGDIINSLVDYDPDLHILSAVLNYNHFLPIGEVVQAIKLLLQNMDDEPEEKAAIGRAINGTSPSGAEPELDITLGLDAASEELDRAFSVLDNGLTIRGHTLRPALIRLHAFPGPIISTTLRSVLSRRDLESLIRLLHFELKTGGWSSYDLDNLEHTPDEISGDNPDDHAVTIIASLLSNTLDAIGAGAWIATAGNSSSMSESCEEIVASLHKDATETLNGFWEARYVLGLLNEFLRYASALPQSLKSSYKRSQVKRRPYPDTAAWDGGAELPMLPMGSKPESKIEKTKRGTGGRREERSKREMGMLISQRVPKYSFERIVL